MALKRRHGNSSENSKGNHGFKDQSRSKNTKSKASDISFTKGKSRSRGPKLSTGYIALVFGIAALCGILHRNHVSGMFERDRHFSHLSTLEREIAFRTEMGLYYSYFKTIIEAPTLASGIQEIVYDNVTEYPLIINTLKRFNLYPEVGLGVAFRVFDTVTQMLNINTKQCWKVNRGEGMSPVWSCEGIGDPHYFYIESVWLLHGLHMSVMFLFATYLSGSIFGGLLTVLSVFYNHGECTRVQWTPPLRESFAYPFLVIELFLITYILKIPRPNYKHSLLLSVSIVFYMLPWQFAQFALMTQMMSVMAIYFLQYIGSHKVKVILYGQMLGLLLSYVCLFGNEMLLTSYFAGCLLTGFVIVHLEPVIEFFRFRVIIWGIQGSLLLVGTVAIKMISGRLLQVKDDAHIGEILKSKFTDFKNFHTMLYTCAAEFDFMEKDMLWKVSKTLLFPCALLSFFAVIFKLLHNEYRVYRQGDDAVISDEEEEEEEDQEVEQNNNQDIAYRSKPHAEILYHIFQLLAFTLMAVIIMRLKLFWTPHLCLITCLIASKQFFSWIGDRNRQLIFIGVVIGLMSIKGLGNLNKQWSILGEFSNQPMEQLIEWINVKTPKNAVFAGPMPTMATVKLCTKRPIVNHPHYEDEGLRNRTIKVYSMFSRKPADQVWQNFMDLQVDYVIMENGWCSQRSKPGCGMAEIYDLEDPSNKDKEFPACHLLKQNPGPYFKRVFRNRDGDVLKVIKKPNLNDGGNGKT